MSEKLTNLVDDEKEPNTVALYIFRCQINGQEYGGEIPALSYEDALSKVSTFGATVDGRAAETQYQNLCAVCRGTISTDETVQNPLTDEDWPEEI